MTNPVPPTTLEQRVQKLENKLAGYTIAAGVLGVASLFTISQFFKVEANVARLDAQVEDASRKASAIKDQQNAAIKAIDDHVPEAIKKFDDQAPGLVKEAIDNKLGQYIEQQKQATSVFIADTCPSWSHQISWTIIVFSEGDDWNPRSLPRGWQESFGILPWGGLGRQWHYIHVPICQRT